MTMTTGAHPKELWPGVKAWFGAVYDEHPAQYTMLFDVEGSDKAFEERVQQNALGLATVKGEGEPIDFEDTSQGYVSRIANITYARGGVVSREAIEDGLYENIATRIAGYLAFSVRQTLENVGANIYNRAFNSSYLGGDGVCLCSASHPVVGGTQSNVLTTAADISEAALEDLLVLIMMAKDSKENAISLIGESLHVHPSEIFETTRILESMGRSGTANNDINAIRALGFLPKGVKANNYFSDSDAWFIRTNAPEGMICQNRRAVEFAKDNVFSTDVAAMKTSVRKGFGWADWRAVYGTPGA